MSSARHIAHAAPADQPKSVQQIAEILYPAYTVAGGRVSMAGCSIEDRLLLQLQFRRGHQTWEVYLDPRGEEVDGAPIAGPEPVALVPATPPQSPAGPQIERLAATGVRRVEEGLSPGEPAQLIGATAIWCKYVEGRLRLTIGSASVEVPFSGWTRTLTPPAWTCPATGTPTFHVAATDDGRIVAEERIEACAETGRRMLGSELVSCSVTGRRVAPDLVETCPVSGRHVLRTQMVQCGTCRQRVSPAVCEQDQCAACRKLKRADASDPRLARVLREHPVLEQWRWWRIAETAQVYILLASRWIRQLLVVVDKESLEIKVVATGSRFRAQWDVVEPAQYLYVLRS